MSAPGFRQMLRMAVRRRKSLQENGETTAYRVFNADGDGLADVTVDWFDGVAVVSCYRDMAPEAEERLVSTVAGELKPRAVYIKRRPREARRITRTQAQVLAPEKPVFGEPETERVVTESGLKYLIRPGRGFAVGLYLDMRDTRQWLRERARSRRVLNCFAYTCAFAVCARAGGAERVVNVDVSRSALEWGEQNVRLNEQSVLRQDYLSGDAFDWLNRFRRRGERFDVVLLDPPSFATTKRTRFSASSDWPRLIANASDVVGRAGVLLACCNQASLPLERFERMVRRGMEDSSREGELIQRLGASAIDFPHLPGKPSSLKVLAYRLD